MKNPTITFFPTANGVVIGISDNDFNTMNLTMNAERFKRVLMHPNHQLTHINWSDIPNHVERYNRDVKVCSEEFADLLQRHPSELERLFKRCFLNVLPELAGAEIKDVKITVYYGENQDAE